MKTNEEEDSRHIFRGELALVIAVMINSLAVILMLYSGSGISAISSVPYAFEKSISGNYTGNMDLYFSGTSDLKSDDTEKKICTCLSVQFSGWICIQ